MIKIAIIFYLIIKIIDKRSLSLSNLIIYDSLKKFFVAIIEIDKRYRLIKSL